MDQHTLLVGQKTRIGGNIFTAPSIVYCGMPSETTFSIGYREMQGNQGYGMNLFFSKDIKTITVKGKHFQVLRVTSEELVLQLIEQ